ncbi:MAG: thiosulfate reductase, partial [Pedobacter sp.]
FHWVNFPLLAVMIWSGLMIYWANSEYTLTIFGVRIYHFFPRSFFMALDLRFRLAEGMAFHFVFMWLFAINGILYVLFTLISGQWRHLVPNRHSFKEAWHVVLHDLHIRRMPVPQKGKYNAAQKIAYTLVIIMGLGSLLTGLAIYKPAQLNWLCAILGGYKTARLIHFILTIGYVFFFVVHIIQVVLAGWNNFRSIITGFEVIKKVKTDKKSKDGE